MDAREEQLRRAIRLFSTSVYGIAFGRLRSSQSSEDVCQETFLALYESGKIFADEGRLKAWLIRVALNKTADVQRRAVKRKEVSIDGADGTSVLKSARYASEDFHACTDCSVVWDLVDELDDDMRIAIHLFYVEGYSAEEIAEICECSSATVRTRLFRARMRIRKLMKEVEANGCSYLVPADHRA